MNHPLHWPPAWPRAHRRQRARFGTRSTSQAVTALLRELFLLGARPGAIVSTNLEVRLDGLPRSGQAQPSDPGVAVYYERVPRGQRAAVRYSFACDAWDRVEDNLRAITLHVGALRGMGRWGVGSIEQAFTGYLAIEAPARSCWDVLGIKEPPPGWSAELRVETVRAAFRDLVKVRHPDVAGGSAAAMAELSAARDEALLLMAYER